MSDISLVGQGREGVWSHKGLDYPLGRWAPPPDRPYEVAPGVRWLRMPLPMSLDHINLWLLDDQDEKGPGTAIVDTGLNASICRDVWSALLPSLRVTRVIATHFHPDHMGLAGWLEGATGAPLWMSRGEYLSARLFQLDGRETPPAEVIAMAVDAGWPNAAVDRLRAQKWDMMGQLAAPLPNGYRRLVDGDRLDIGGRIWRVMMGHGHSPEHACLISDDDGLMISGDQVLPQISSNVSVHAMEPMADPLGGWLDSIDSLRSLSDKMLVLPAHGFPFHGLHERLDQLAGEHRRQLDELCDFCTTPRTVHECFAVLFKRQIDDSALILASGEAWAHLRRLECEGRVVRERHGRELRFRTV